MSSLPGAQGNKFDFMVGEWQIKNRRKRGDAWVEFSSVNMGQRFLDGYTIVDTYDAVLGDGSNFKGMTIRAYDKQADNWKIVWLDERNPPDFEPLVGKFDPEGVGRFHADMVHPDGSVTKVRFVWDQISKTTARWQQFFSRDGGQTWDLDWVMEFSRE